jgi:predicted nuclease of predicted toxin-antitoxin system
LIVWLDNHLSPALGRWIAAEFGHECLVVRDLGMARAADMKIFEGARAGGAVLVSKDRDFVELLDRLGPPPSIILLTFGNTSTAHLQILLRSRLPTAFALIERGEPLVEIGGEN